MSSTTAKRTGGEWLDSWDPENEETWDKRLAWTTLSITTFTLTLCFASWFLASAIAPKKTANSSTRVRRPLPRACGEVAVFMQGIFSWLGKGCRPTASTTGQRVVFCAIPVPAPPPARSAPARTTARRNPGGAAAAGVVVRSGLAAAIVGA